MKNFDRQLLEFKTQLLSDVKIPPDKVQCVASTIAAEVKQKKDELRQKMISVSPVSLGTRHEELSAFQTMMDIFRKMEYQQPELVRTQVIAQNYICFVYLKESLFDVLKKNSDDESLTKKCTKFLLNNSVRAFRNSIAHGNWKYLNDFSGLEYWACKGELGDQMTKFEVSQSELKFWQMLSKVVAYTTFITLREK